MAAQSIEFLNVAVAGFDSPDVAAQVQRPNPEAVVRPFGEFTAITIIGGVALPQCVVGRDTKVDDASRVSWETSFVPNAGLADSRESQQVF